MRGLRMLWWWCMGVAVALLSLPVFAVEGKMHCYQAGGEPQFCAGSPKQAGEMAMQHHDGGIPVFPGSAVYSTDGQGRSYYHWTGWSGGGHLSDPPGPITSGGRWYFTIPDVQPSVPGGQYGAYSSGTTNFGYSSPVQECPSGWDVGADGFCFEPPPEDVCAAKAGQPGPVLRGNFDGFENDTYTDADGCTLEAAGSVSCAIPYTEENAQREFFPPVCSIPSQYTGEYVPDSAPTQLSAPEPATATTDSRQTTETVTADPVEVTNNPDGSTTTTQRITRTKVADAGTTVENQNSRSVVVSQEGGRTIVTVTETQTTEQPDGTTVTTTTTTKSVTSTPKTTTKVDASAPKPTVTVEQTPETTDSGQTRTTVTTYPDGSTESQTETTGGGGQGAEGVSETPGESDEPVPDGAAAAGDLALPGLGEVPGFGESVQQFWTDVQAAPIAGVASSLTGLSDAGGTCPAPSFSIFGTTFTLDFHCQVWPDIAPVIEAAALAGWAILAVLILLSA